MLDLSTKEVFDPEGVAVCCICPPRRHSTLKGSQYVAFVHQGGIRPLRGHSMLDLFTKEAFDPEGVAAGVHPCQLLVGTITSATLVRIERHPPYGGQAKTFEQ